MFDTVKRAFKKFQADEMTDHAAALTYYAMMSLFPALLVTVALLGILGDQTLVTKAVDYARQNGAPSEVVSALRSSLEGVVNGAGGAVSLTLVFGIAVAHVVGLELLDRALDRAEHVARCFPRRRPANPG